MIARPTAIVSILFILIPILGACIAPDSVRVRNWCDEICEKEMACLQEGETFDASQCLNDCPSKYNVDQYTDCSKDYIKFKNCWLGMSCVSWLDKDEITRNCPDELAAIEDCGGGWSVHFY